jgi:acyl-CoA synthetase (AMP-forming)/AMP-acid ligase II
VLIATRPRSGEPQWSDRRLGSLLEAAGRSRPDAEAVAEGQSRLTYRQLLAAAEALAAGFDRLGLRRGEPLCLILPNWAETVVAMHAALRLGAVVNPVVPIYRDREIGFILRQSRPAVVVIPHRFRRFDFVEMMQRLLPTLDQRPSVVVARPEGPLPAGFIPWGNALSPGAERALTGSAEDICLLLYTSGTTADPKGVLHSHQTLEYEIRSIADLFGLGAADTVFMPSPLTHITGFLYGVLLPAMLGSSCVLLDVWDAHVAHRLIEAERCRFTDGRPIGPVEVRLDHDGDGPGELLVRGPELFLGYLDPELNDDSFTADGFFRTGDLASIDAGTVTIRGRLKDIIVRGGENISAKEVEDLLFEHPDVADVAVVAMPDPVLVERVCAFVIPAGGSIPTLASLTELLSDRGLARQKHPERLVLIDELPKTASGKVQKFALRERIATTLAAQWEAVRSRE